MLGGGRRYITQQGDKSAAAERSASQAVTIQATGAISWRKEGIKYRKNELFIDVCLTSYILQLTSYILHELFIDVGPWDRPTRTRGTPCPLGPIAEGGACSHPACSQVVENCNLLVSSKGTILRNDVSGAIQVKCYLSGTPECKFGLNDKLLLDNEAKAKAAANRRPGSGIEIDDVSFHQCVKLGKFDMDRTISFVRAQGSHTVPGAHTVPSRPRHPVPSPH